MLRVEQCVILFWHLWIDYIVEPNTPHLGQYKAVLLLPHCSSLSVAGWQTIRTSCIGFLIRRAELKIRFRLGAMRYCRWGLCVCAIGKTQVSRFTLHGLAPTHAPKLLGFVQIPMVRSLLEWNRVAQLPGDFQPFWSLLLVCIVCSGCV